MKPATIHIAGSFAQCALAVLGVTAAVLGVVVAVACVVEGVLAAVECEGRG